MLTIHDTILYQFVRSILSRQRTRVGQQQHGLLDETHVKPTLLAALHLFVETLGSLDGVLYTLMPNLLNKSSTESY